MVLANRICKHALCEVGLVGATGIPTHLPVAAVFQLAEYEQMVTTIVSRNKIELNFKDPWPEAEKLTADHAEAHILAKENTAWTWATQQRNVERLWELWCEANLHKRAKQDLGGPKAQTGRGQVRQSTAEKRNNSIRRRKGTKAPDTLAAQVGKTN